MFKIKFWAQTAMFKFRTYKKWDHCREWQNFKSLKVYHDSRTIAEHSRACVHSGFLVGIPDSNPGKDGEHILAESHIFLIVAQKPIHSKIDSNLKLDYPPQKIEIRDRKNNIILLYIWNHLDYLRWIELFKQNTIIEEWQGCYSKNAQSKNVQSMKQQKQLMIL